MVSTGIVYSTYIIQHKITNEVYKAEYFYSGNTEMRFGHQVRLTNETEDKVLKLSTVESSYNKIMEWRA
jgi:hypothetical protein